MLSLTTSKLFSGASASKEPETIELDESTARPWVERLRLEEAEKISSFRDIDDGGADDCGRLEHSDDDAIPMLQRAPWWTRIWSYRAAQVAVILLIILLGALNLVHLSGTNHGSALRSALQPLQGTSPSQPAGKAVVLASFRGQEVDWATTIPEDWRVYRYVNDDPSPFAQVSSEAHATASNRERVYNLTYTTPRNLGREAMSYLSFIVDHYDNLPIFTLFLHGHDRSWHQLEHAVDKIRALNLAAVAQEGYVNVRCFDARQCDSSAIKDLTNTTTIRGLTLKPLSSFWKLVFPEGPPLPTKYQAITYAQFAVYRAVIHARPLSYWRGLQRLLERDPREYYEQIPELKAAVKVVRKAVRAQGVEADSWVFGMMFEHLWHVLMGKPAVYCPDEEFCKSTVFSGALQCDGVVEKPKQQKGWEKIGCTADEETMQRNARAQDEAVESARASLASP